MDRRTVIAGTGLVLCGGSGYYILTRRPLAPETSATGPEPALEVGTRTTIPITATRTGAVSLFESSGLDGVQVETDEDRMDPPPDEIDYPRRGGKIWKWDSPTQIEIEILVTVTEDAETGVYRYQLHIAEQRPETREDQRVVEEFSITIKDD